MIPSCFFNEGFRIKLGTSLELHTAKRRLEAATAIKNGFTQALPALYVMSEQHLIITQ